MERDLWLYLDENIVTLVNDTIESVIALYLPSDETVEWIDARLCYLLQEFEASAHIHCFTL